MRSGSVRLERGRRSLAHFHSQRKIRPAQHPCRGLRHISVRPFIAPVLRGARISSDQTGQETMEFDAIAIRGLEM